MAQQEKSMSSDIPAISSRLMEYLPSVYQEGDATGHVLDHFLLAFETILLGLCPSAATF